MSGAASNVFGLWIGNLVLGAGDVRGQPPMFAYLDRHDPDFIKGKKSKVDITTKGESMPVRATIEHLGLDDPDYLEFQRQRLLES